MKNIVWFALFMVVMLGGGYITTEAIKSYNSPEAIKARSEAVQTEVMAQEARMDQIRQIEMAEAERLDSIERAKSPEQRQREAEARRNEAMDSNSMSVGEYVGARVVMNLLLGI